MNAVATVRADPRAEKRQRSWLNKLQAVFLQHALKSEDVQVLDAVSNRLQDYDEKVRSAAVTAICASATQMPEVRAALAHGLTCVIVASFLLCAEWKAPVCAAVELFKLWQSEPKGCRLQACASQALTDVCRIRT